MKALLEKMDFCPYCGNINPDEFGIHEEDRPIFALDGACFNHVYQAACSCGAAGPDANTPIEAVDAWNKRPEKERRNEIITDLLEAQGHILTLIGTDGAAVKAHRLIGGTLSELRSAWKKG
jgi:hypothetical protein